MVCSFFPVLPEREREKYGIFFFFFFFFFWIGVHLLIITVGEDDFFGGAKSAGSLPARWKFLWR